ncbi:MAG: cupin domain-containing protein, partial [Caulobacteraceae bacterium]
VTGICISMSVLPAALGLIACLFIWKYRLPPIEASARKPDTAPAGAIAAITLALVGAGFFALHQPAQAAELPAPTASALPAQLMIPRLYAGADGKSRLDEVALPLASADVHSLMTRLYTTDLEMGLSSPGTFIDWHKVSTPRLLLVLSGEIEVGLGDGSKHLLRAGDMVFVTDTTGQGHTSRMIGTAPVKAITLRLDKDDPLKLKPNPCPLGMDPAACVANHLVVTHTDH